MARRLTQLFPVYRRFQKLHPRRQRLNCQKKARENYCNGHDLPLVGLHRMCGLYRYGDRIRHHFLRNEGHHKIGCPRQIWRVTDKKHSVRSWVILVEQHLNIAIQDPGATQHNRSDRKLLLDLAHGQYLQISRHRRKLKFEAIKSRIGLNPPNDVGRIFACQ